MEEPQKYNLHLPFLNLVYILPTLAAQSKPEAPAAKAKAIPSALPMQYFRKLVAYVQTFATTSQTLAAAHIAWHSGWPKLKPSWFRFGALRLSNYTSCTSSNNLQRLEKLVWGGGGGGRLSLPHFLF